MTVLDNKPLGPFYEKKCEISKSYTESIIKLWIWLIEINFYWSFGKIYTLEETKKKLNIKYAN